MNALLGYFTGHWLSLTLAAVSLYSVWYVYKHRAKLIKDKPEK